MKNISTLMLCICITCTSLTAFSQNNQDVPPLNEPDYNKPMLFASYPERIPVDLASLNSLFGVSLGSSVDVNVAEGSTFRLTGEVVSNVSKYDNRIKSVVIRSTNFPGARLCINRITGEDGSISYTGRLLSKDYGDVYELQNNNNHFVLVKRGYYDIVTE